MQQYFPEPISNLPQADIPMEGVIAHISQADNHQVLFMYFTKDVKLPEHQHGAQVGFVLSGVIELNINGEKQIFTRGDQYYIPPNTKHSGFIFSGYSDITFFGECERYSPK